MRGNDYRVTLWVDGARESDPCVTNDYHCAVGYARSSVGSEYSGALVEKGHYVDGEFVVDKESLRIGDTP